MESSRLKLRSVYFSWVTSRIGLSPAPVQKYFFKSLLPKKFNGWGCTLDIGKPRIEPRLYCPPSSRLCSHKHFASIQDLQSKFGTLPQLYSEATTEVGIIFRGMDQQYKKYCLEPFNHMLPEPSIARHTKSSLRPPSSIQPCSKPRPQLTLGSV